MTDITTNTLNEQVPIDPMVDSFEQDPLDLETGNDSEINKSISSDDSIELNNEPTVKTSPKPTENVKKSPISDQKKDYLLKNLQNSQQNSSMQIAASRTEIDEQVVSEFIFLIVFIFIVIYSFVYHGQIKVLYLAINFIYFDYYLNSRKFKKR